MDELSASPKGHDRLQVMRTAIVNGKLFRLRLEQINHTTVTVSLLVGGGERLTGYLEGRIEVNDMVSASHALASLIGGAAVTQGRAIAATDGRIEEARQSHPNAYAPWTEEDDVRLMERYMEKASIAELSKEFGRKPSAIRSRLERVVPPGQYRDDLRGKRSGDQTDLTTGS